MRFDGRSAVALTVLLVLFSAFAEVPLARSESMYVVASVTVHGGPQNLAYVSSKGEVFVTDSAYGANSVSVISDSTNSVAANVSVGSDPVQVAYDSSKGEVFVSNFESNTVSVISDSNNAVVATIPVGSGPGGLAYDSAKGEVFVSNYASNTVSVISDSTNTVVANISIASSGTGGSGPSGIAYDPTKGELYVADSDSCTGYCPISSNTVSVISDSDNRVVANVTVGEWPSTVAFDAAKDEMFVGTSYGGAAPNNITVISDATNAVVANLVLGNERGLGSMAYDPASGVILATTGVGAIVYMISDSTNTVVGNLTLGGVYGTGGAYGVTYDSGKGELFVSDGSSKVFVFSGSAASSTTATSIPSTASSTGAVPVFPFQPALAGAFTVALVLTYLLIRRQTISRTRVRLFS